MEADACPGKYTTEVLEAFLVVPSDKWAQSLSLHLFKYYLPPSLQGEVILRRLLLSIEDISVEPNDNISPSSILFSNISRTDSLGQIQFFLIKL